MIKFQSNTEDVGNLILYTVTVDPSEDLVAHLPKESSEPWLTQRTSLSDLPSSNFLVAHTN